MDNINNKMLIVVDKDGNYKSLGNLNNYDEYHIDNLMDYAFFTYPKVNFTNENRNDAFHKIIYCLISDDKAVYLHSKGYGLLFMPKNQTPNQIKTLYDIFEKLDKTCIYVNYNLKLNESNKLNGSMTSYKENALALDEYLNKKAQELAYKKTNKQLIRKKQN